MTRFLALFLTGCLVLAPACFAAGLEQPPVNFKETIDIGVSTNEIAITSDFSGADLTVFGALDNSDPFLQAIGQYDIVVTLEGPKTDVILRKKERVAGIWINRQSMTFDSVPESYSLASTRVIDTITTPLELSNVSIGISDIRLAPTNYIGSLNDLGNFRDAFRRLKTGKWPVSIQRRWYPVCEPEPVSSHIAIAGQCAERGAHRPRLSVQKRAICDGEKTSAAGYQNRV